MLAEYDARARSPIQVILVGGFFLASGCFKVEQLALLAFGLDILVGTRSLAEDRQAERDED